MKDKPKREISPQFRAIKRQYASCFSALFASFLIGLAVRTILNAPTVAILVKNSMYNNNITILIDGVIGLIVALIVIFILSFNDGYRKNKFVFKQLLLAILLVFVTQVVLTIVLGHSVWFSGPTNFIARYVFRTRHFETIGMVGSKKLLESYRWLFMMLSFWFAYAPLIIAGKYLGVKKSKKDFAKAREEKEKEKVFGEHLP